MHLLMFILMLMFFKHFCLYLYFMFMFIFTSVCARLSVYEGLRNLLLHGNIPEDAVNLGPRVHTIMYYEPPNQGVSSVCWGFRVYTE